MGAGVQKQINGKPALNSQIQQQGKQKNISLTPTQSQQRQSILKINYANLEKNKFEFKLGLVGARPAVGKSMLIQTFIKQTTEQNELSIQQTLGSDVSMMLYDYNDVTQVKLQIWEFDSNDQSIGQWHKQINGSFDVLIMVFDEFGEQCAEQIKERVQLLQKICNTQKLKGKIPIFLVGNDRLNMMITGKEFDIETSLKKLYDGNKIIVKIIDFKQLKEINILFKVIITELLNRNTSPQSGK